MDHIPSYDPAWAYTRAGWPPTTGLVWNHSNHHGDQLRLWLPDGLLAVNVYSEEGIEPLAWQEARFGALPKTWISGPEKHGGRFGAYIYRVAKGHRWRGDVTMGVVASNTFLAPPTITEEGRYRWFDQLRMPSATPYLQDLAELPRKWQDELTTGLNLDNDPAPSISTHLERFLRETFVATGNNSEMVTTEDIYEVYKGWADLNQVPPLWRVNKIHLARWMSTSREFRRWAGRTPAGYRRGFTGLRLPEVRDA